MELGIFVITSEGTVAGVCEMFKSESHVSVEMFTSTNLETRKKKS